MQQKNEDSIEMRLETEAQARSVAFLFTNLSKYFVFRPTRSPKTICQRCAASGYDREASDFPTNLSVCPDCGGSGFLISYVDTRTGESDQRDSDRYAAMGERGWM